MKIKSIVAGILLILSPLYTQAQQIRFDAILGKERNLRLDLVMPKLPIKSDLFMTLENNVSRIRYNIMPLQKGNWHFGVGGHYLNLKEIDVGPTITYKDDRIFNQTNIYVLNKKIFNKTHVNYKKLELDILTWYQKGGNYLFRPGLTYWLKNGKFKAGIGIESTFLNINGNLKKTCGIRGSFKL